MNRKELVEVVARAMFIAENTSPFDDDLQNCWSNSAQAALKAIEDAGYVVVPKETSEGVAKAGVNSKQDWHERYHGWFLVS
jgi:hypothetical protein